MITGINYFSPYNKSQISFGMASPKSIQSSRGIEAERSELVKYFEPLVDNERCSSTWAVKNRMNDMQTQDLRILKDFFETFRTVNKNLDKYFPQEVGEPEYFTAIKNVQKDFKKECEDRYNPIQADRRKGYSLNAILERELLRPVDTRNPKLVAEDFVASLKRILPVHEAFYEKNPEDRNSAMEDLVFDFIFCLEDFADVHEKIQSGATKCPSISPWRMPDKFIECFNGAALRNDYCIKEYSFHEEILNNPSKYRKPLSPGRMPIVENIQLQEDITKSMSGYCL